MILQSKEIFFFFLHFFFTGQRSAASNVSGNRYKSDCRSRGSQPGLIFFMEIDREIISTVILLLLSAASFKKGCCQLQAKVYARSTG